MAENVIFLCLVDFQNKYSHYLSKQNLANCALKNWNKCFGVPLASEKMPENISCGLNEVFKCFDGRASKGAVFLLESHERNTRRLAKRQNEFGKKKMRPGAYFWTC